jgi:uncharacterized protein
MVTYSDLATGTPDRPVPARPWLMAQEWQNVLFLHWAVDPGTIRDRIPAGLELQTWEGRAWITLVPLHMADIHLRHLPPIFHFEHFAELNFRTYVTKDGFPGVWFFDILADNRPSCWIGRLLFHAPYRDASASLTSEQEHFDFKCRRGSTICSVRYTPHGDPFTPKAGSLDLSLTERYAMYVTGWGGRLLRGVIHHSPWELRQVDVEIEEDSVLTADGFPGLGPPDRAFFSSGTRSVVWSLERA